MKIANGIAMLSLTAGEGQAFNAAVVWDEQDVVLVDTGLPMMQTVIKSAMEELGIPFERLNTVIITHHDTDHLGSLPELLKLSAQKITVLAHENEKLYIEGQEHLLVKIEKPIQSLPPAQQEERRQAYLKRQTVTVDRAVVDGEELPYCGGIVIIHTPGHTPGHICLYHKPSRTVIAGDATVAEAGKLQGPSPIFTVDMEEAKQSLKKLLDYEVEQMICYHGGLVKEKVREQLKAVTA